MDGFSYVDIFATKGVEYVVVIAYFVVFTLFIRTLRSAGKRERKTEAKK